MLLPIVCILFGWCDDGGAETALRVLALTLLLRFFAELRGARCRAREVEEPSIFSDRDSTHPAVVVFVDDAVRGGRIERSVTPFIRYVGNDEMHYE